MKRLFVLAFSAIMMAICTNAALAKEEPGKKQRKSREEVAEAQARHIAYELAFDDATAQKFIVAYRDYQKEMWSIDRPGKRGEKSSVKERLEHGQKILDLRKKYYQRLSEFLTEKQVERAFELEHHSMKQMAKPHRGHKSAKKGKRTPKRHQAPPYRPRP